MCFYMFFKVLRPFEGLATKLASVRLQGDMDTNVRCDMISLHDLNAAAPPRTSQVEVVGAFATDVHLAHMFLADD